MLLNSKLKLIGLAFWLLALPAVPSDVPKCTLTLSSGSATSTTSNTNCKWTAGAPLKIQCPSAVVYYRADGTAADSSGTSWRVDFTANPDPYYVQLNTQETQLSLIAASGTPTCLIGVVQ